jgi:hypothetical protein
MTTYESKGVSNGLNDVEKNLLEELRTADPGTRFKMACNLAKSGHWHIVGALNEPGLLGAIQRALKVDGTTDLDTSGAVDIPMKNFDSKGMM